MDLVTSTQNVRLDCGVSGLHCLDKVMPSRERRPGQPNGRNRAHLRPTSTISVYHAVSAEWCTQLREFFRTCNDENTSHSNTVMNLPVGVRVAPALEEPLH
jgi:hypothetical protein